MTRDSGFKLASWQTTLIWIIGLLFLAGATYGSIDSRLKAMEAAGNIPLRLSAVEKSDESKKTQLDRIERKVDEIKEAMPLIKQHLDKDTVLKPSDIK